MKGPTVPTKSTSAKMCGRHRDREIVWKSVVTIRSCSTPGCYDEVMAGFGFVRKELLEAAMREIDKLQGQIRRPLP